MRFHSIWQSNPGATFEGLLNLLTCTRANDQASAAVAVKAHVNNMGNKCAFIESRFRPSVQSASDMLGEAKLTCCSRLRRRFTETAIATHNSIHYLNAEDRKRAAAAQAQLQKVVHSSPSTESTFVYEVVEIGNLKGVVRLRADTFVGDVQSDTLAVLSQSLFNQERLNGDEPWGGGGVEMKAVLLQLQP